MCWLRRSVMAIRLPSSILLAKRSLCLWAKSHCASVSITVAGRKRPLRHLVSCSQELVDASADRKPLLVSDDDMFIWSSLMCHYGLPVTLDWGAWVLGQLKRDQRIQPLPGFGYRGFVVRASRTYLLVLLRRGLRSQQLRFPNKNGPAEWPEVRLPHWLPATRECAANPRLLADLPEWDSYSTGSAPIRLERNCAIIGQATDNASRIKCTRPPCSTILFERCRNLLFLSAMRRCRQSRRSDCHTIPHLELDQ